MDRLVVGDVGFGKTEVARAALPRRQRRPAGGSSRPRRLALQHFTRFSASRGVPGARGNALACATKPTAEVIQGLEGVDIVIGTHRLVQNDVRFKDLGLVVIDEEQRFGVRQKEFLKKLRTEVDVLTMSATPIPAPCTWRLPGFATLA